MMRHVCDGASGIRYRGCCNIMGAVSRLVKFEETNDQRNGDDQYNSYGERKHGDQQHFTNVR